MKKIILSILFIATALISARAQFSLFATVNAKAGILKGTSFKRFADSYNIANPDNETKLKNFGLAYGYSITGDMFFNDASLYMGYYQHRMMANTESKINKYYTRVFHVVQKSYGGDFGFGASEDGQAFAVFMGIYFATSNLKSGLTYRDGYTSYGSDAILNGIFHSFSFSGSLGAKYIACSGPIGVSAAIRWSPLFGASEYFDFGRDANQIGEDWKAYTSVPSYNYSGKFLTSAAQSFSIDLGLAIHINKD